MSEIQKGIILTLEGTTDVNNNPTRASVQSTSAAGTSTLPLTIPWYLRGSMGNLRKGTEVVYALFDDSTGVILSRMDGEWSQTIDGSVTAGQMQADVVTSKGVVLATHCHGGVETGSGNTGGPS